VAESEYSHPVFIIPFCYESNFHEVDRSAHFEASNALVHKIWPSRETWRSTRMDLIDNILPV
jgi:hypothetical protein